jgi:hypothetical protein
LAQQFGLFRGVEPPLALVLGNVRLQVVDVFLELLDGLLLHAHPPLHVVHPLLVLVGLPAAGPDVLEEEGVDVAAVAGAARLVPMQLARQERLPAAEAGGLPFAEGVQRPAVHLGVGPDFAARRAFMHLANVHAPLADALAALAAHGHRLVEEVQQAGAAGNAVHGGGGVNFGNL